MDHGVIVEAEPLLVPCDSSGSGGTSCRRRVGCRPPVLRSTRGRQRTPSGSEPQALSHVGVRRPRYGGGTETAQRRHQAVTSRPARSRDAGIGAEVRPRGLSARSDGSTTSRCRLPRSGDGWARQPRGSACRDRAMSTCGGSSSANANARRSFGRSGTRPLSAWSPGWRPIRSISHFAAARCSPVIADVRVGRSRDVLQRWRHPCGSEPQALSPGCGVAPFAWSHAAWFRGGGWPVIERLAGGRSACGSEPRALSSGCGIAVRAVRSSQVAGFRGGCGLVIERSAAGQGFVALSHERCLSSERWSGAGCDCLAPVTGQAARADPWAWIAIRLLAAR